VTRETYAPKVQTVPTIAATLLLHFMAAYRSRNCQGTIPKNLLSTMRFLAVVSNVPLAQTTSFSSALIISGPDGQVALARFDSHFVLTLGGLASGA